MNNGKIFDLKNKIKTIHTFFNEHIKTIIFCLIFLGFINVLFYSLKNQIPFPISFSTLSTLLLVIAAIILIIGITFSIIFMIPLLIQANIFRDVYPDAKVMSKKNIKFFFEFSGFFLIMILIPPALGDYFEVWIWVVSGVLGLALTCLSAWEKTNNDKRVEFVVQLFFVNCFSFIWIVLVITYLPHITPLHISHITYIPFCVIILIISYILMLPINERRIYILTLIGGVCLILMNGSSFTKKAFYILKLGGEYKTVYYIDQSKEKNLPQIILDKSTKGKTKEVLVLLNIGDTKYIKLENDSKNTVYGIKKNLIFAEEILE